jgi:hypothetical protein
MVLEKRNRSLGTFRRGKFDGSARRNYETVAPLDLTEQPPVSRLLQRSAQDTG